MGLDMYLKTDAFVSGFQHNNPAEQAKYELIINTLGIKPCEQSPWITVEYTVAYWRKANHIHAWFVNNVQDGVDECQKSYVSAEQLQELVDTCRRAAIAYDAGNKNGAKEVLPPQEGFFFGGYEIDEYYRADLQYTIDTLLRILKEHPDESFFYQASW